MAKNSQKLLVDTYPFFAQLVEAEDGKTLKVRGEFGKTGIKTENNRVYPRPLLERELKRLLKNVQERKVLGELDHPTDGRTMLSRCSHLVSGLCLENDIVIGEAEPLDTERGKTLKALLQSGVKLGVSSRGYGSVKKNSNGEDVVQDDYRLVTYDFVAEPADSTAYPEVVFEENEHMKDLTQLTAEELRASNPAIVEQLTQEREQELAAEWAKKLESLKKETTDKVRQDLKDEFAQKLLSVVEQVKTKVREELLLDPSFIKERNKDLDALQKTITDKDAQIAQLQDESQKLAAVAKEVGYKFFLEQLIAHDENQDLIRKLVGNVLDYDKADSISKKVDAIREGFDKQERTATKVSRDVLKETREVMASKEKEVSALKDEVSQVYEALEESVKTNRELAAQLYAEKRLLKHPKADHIRDIIEAANPKTKEDVDKVFDSYREPVRDTESLDKVRARVRALTRGGHGPSPIMEEMPRAPQVERENYNHLGCSITELKTLAGIRPKN